MSQHAIISMHRCRFSPVQISHTGRRQGDARNAMHELAITQNIVDIALKSAPERQVQGITIVLGELSGIVEDSVRFCFEVVAADTAAKGAALTFTRSLPISVVPNAPSSSSLTTGTGPAP